MDFPGLPLFYRKGVPSETIQTLLNYALSPPAGSKAEKMLKKEFSGEMIKCVMRTGYGNFFTKSSLHVLSLPEKGNII